MASSSSGGSGGTSGGSRPPSGGGYSGGQPPRGSGGSGQSPFSSSSSGRPTRPTAPAGQERLVSYQREEERYWTDYLRVALPVIGLLLMLGLFWYWAQSLIGDDDDNGSPTEITQLVTDPTPIPTDVPQVAISPTPQERDTAQTDTEDEAEPTPPGETDGEDGQQDDGETTQQDGEDQTQGGQTDDADGTDQQDDGSQVAGFAEGDIVTVTEAGDQLNMRTDPTTEEENVVNVLPFGTELVIIGGPQEAEGYIWYQVRNDATEEEGWVVDDVSGSPTIDLS